MPQVPTSYDWAALATFAHGELGGVARLLGWTVESERYNDAIIDALVAYGGGITDPNDVTGLIEIDRLRKLTRREVWKRATSALTALVDTSDGDTRHSLSQAHKQAVTALQLAESDVRALGDSDWAVRVHRMDPVHDPYLYPNTFTGGARARAEFG